MANVDAYMTQLAPVEQDTMCKQLAEARKTVRGVFKKAAQLMYSEKEGPYTFDPPIMECLLVGAAEFEWLMAILRFNATVVGAFTPISGQLEESTLYNEDFEVCLDYSSLRVACRKRWLEQPSETRERIAPSILHLLNEDIIYIANFEHKLKMNGCVSSVGVHLVSTCKFLVQTDAGDEKGNLRWVQQSAKEAVESAVSSNFCL